MGERWANDAREEEADAQVSDVVVALIAQYGAAGPATRPPLAEKMRLVLAGEITDFDTLLEELPAEAPPAEDWEGDADFTGELVYEESFPPPEPTHIARER